MFEGRDAPTIAEDVALALRLSDLAAAVARPLFEVGVDAETKADGSPVTVADLTVERALLDELAAERPDDAILSEETGALGRSSRRWLIDPIDGTEKFLEGDPSWGTHLALEVDGRVVLGVMSRPVLERRWWAADSLGAHRSAEGTMSDVEVQTSDETSLAASRVSVWSEGPSVVAEKLDGLTTLVEPAYDDYLNLIEGRIEAVIFPRPGVAFAWDHAPAVILAAEAGGRFRDFSGGQRIDIGTGVFSNKAVDLELDAALSKYL